MRLVPVLGTVTAVLALAVITAGPAAAAPVLALGQDGRATLREDPFLPPPVDVPAGPAPAARAADRAPVARSAAGRRTVPGELARLRRAGAIDEATHDAHLATWTAARRALGRVEGRRRVELGGALRNVEDVARRGGLTSGRLAAAFETVRRNREWWTTGPLPAPGRRVTFPGSPLVWQFYPGEGMQIQWLGTFGKANGLFQSGRHDPQLAALLDEAVRLAAPRAGGLAWESWFRFGGGAPPWASALSQGTALQALSRGAIRLRRGDLFAAARQGLGIFRTAPPTGVRVRTDAGAHYLIYSFSPRLRVLNGFVQSLVGLRDFGALANDDEARALFRAGEAQLRAEVPRYDTGAWSKYSQARESDLGYHTLLRDFLRNLCGRLTDDRERAARAAAVPAGDPSAGGVAPVADPSVPPPAPASVPDPALYCDTASRFTAYLKERPTLELQRSAPATARARTAVRVPYRLSKISTVTTRVTRRGTVVAGRTARLGGGRHDLRFTPRTPGPHVVTVRAVDLAGNATRRTTTVRVAAARRR